MGCVKSTVVGQARDDIFCKIKRPMDDSTRTKLSVALMNELRNLTDLVTDVSEQIRDNDFKRIVDAAKAIYDECLQEKTRVNASKKHMMMMQGQLTYQLVENMVAVIVRDEPWSSLTITELKKQIARRSGGLVAATAIGDVVLSEMMRKHVAEVTKRQRQKASGKQRGREELEDDVDEAPLFPLHR